MQLGQKNKMKLENLSFVGPCLILVGIMVYLPFVMSMYYSMTKWNGIAKEPIFIGFQNFINLFTGDQNFVRSILFTAKYSILFIVVVNIISLLLAVALVKKLKTANILRAIFFIPYIMSMIIVGFIWRFIFSQGFASLQAMTDWGIFKLSWLGDTKLAFYSIIIVSIWQAVGFYMVIYIAGLQAIPDDVLEAATVDGAGGSYRFFHVVLPLLGPSITTCIFMSLTNSIKVFDIILALTGGGPGGTTYSVTLDIYREAFQNNNYGLGAAKSLVLFVIVLALTTFVLHIFKKKEVEM
ncbi:MAG: transporter permease [Clostridia bacterium]|jgi:raffinose/stachyose/melibiose transport system permease protein|nr:transporter permease [Clostridia bacterium]